MHGLFCFLCSFGGADELEENSSKIVGFIYLIM